MRMSYALVLLLAACAGDRSITHGADGAPEWDRRLQAAIPVGTDAVAARATLEANQFHCASADSLGGFRIPAPRRCGSPSPTCIGPGP